MKTMISIALIAVSLTGCASIGVFGPSKNARYDYAMSHANELTQEQRFAIEKGGLTRGMTKEMVRASWGDPCSYCGGGHNSYGDTWAYNIFGTGSAGVGDTSYVFFSPSGYVTGWSMP